MTAPLADLIGAVHDRLVALPNTGALVGSRVSTRLRVKDPKTDPGGWPMPGYAIVLFESAGPTEARPGNVPLRSQNIQIECYGPDPKGARQLWRTLHAELFPDPPVAQSFKAAGCAVVSITESMSPLMQYGPDTPYPRIVSTYLFQYCERAVS